MQPLSLARSRNFRSHELNDVARLIEEHREEIERNGMNTLAEKIEPLAVDVSFTEDACVWCWQMAERSLRH